MISKISAGFIKYFSIIIFFFSLIKINSVIAQSKVLQVGEELNYSVNYGFIEIGKVNIKMTGSRQAGNNVIYTSVCSMKSNKGIPFVELNSIFESDMLYNGNDLYTVRFKATEIKEEGKIIIEYRFNYDSNYVYVLKENLGNKEIDRNIPFNQNVKFQDGLSLFYKSRLNSFSQENFLIPVFMNESETSVNYYFTSKKDEIFVPVFDGELQTYRCNGMANFEGVFGLSGEFAGWFSDDDARVPLKSQMNVIIGSVTLELTSFKRSGWR
ncbi:MAG TPA: DUF3108 domain-containing protein [Ignavibacteria bacterium]|nr:DUF3108 domain-containing protein [Ignavibacteria bacterium]HRJ98209.1 DUF3108 domain-containing protein [Ignavibacteria bacterium]